MSSHGTVLRCMVCRKGAGALFCFVLSCSVQGSGPSQVAHELLDFCWDSVIEVSLGYSGQGRKRSVRSQVLLLSISLIPQVKSWYQSQRKGIKRIPGRPR